MTNPHQLNRNSNSISNLLWEWHQGSGQIWEPDLRGTPNLQYYGRFEGGIP